jgi:hypothetical protein
VPSQALFRFTNRFLGNNSFRGAATVYRFRTQGGGDVLHAPVDRCLSVAFVLLASLALFGVKLLPNPLKSIDATGVLSTYSTNGGVDITNPFFQNLGTNGRTCNSCHISSSAWTITPADVQAKFAASAGSDPIFRTKDGSNCPSADVSTVSARRAAYSQLLSKALIRISLAVPPRADFRIIGIQDPYNCPETTASAPALYRRPLPAANLKFLSTIMWDGRETVFPDATTGHAQGVAPTAQQLSEIVSFETGLFTAQANDNKAGVLTASGATGGPINLSNQNLFCGHQRLARRRSFRQYV